MPAIELFESVLVVLIVLSIVLTIVKIREMSKPKRQLKSILRKIYYRLSSPQPLDAQRLTEVISMFANDIERQGLGLLLREQSPELLSLLDELRATRDKIERWQVPAECARLAQEGKRSRNMEYDAFRRPVRDDARIQQLAKEIRSAIEEKVLRPRSPS